MMPNISRHSPDTCGCVVELECDGDKEPIFLMMNTVCDKHRPLASTLYKANHSLLSNHVLDLIEEAKTKNLKQVNDLIGKEKSAFRKKDLMRCRQQVIDFNAKLDEEWAELIQPPHAFDSHIHGQIRQEQLAKANG